MICTKWIQRCEELSNMLCTHWWGLHPIGLHLKNVIKGSHGLFIVGAYEIWCILYELSKMMCLKPVDLVNQVLSRNHDVMCDYLWNLNTIGLFIEHN
jgi:hypothetical protein